MPTDAERAVLDGVRDLARAGRRAADIEVLTRIPSLTGTHAEADAQAWVARRLERLGFEVDHWRMDLAELAARPRFPGMDVDHQEAWGWRT